MQASGYRQWQSLCVDNLCLVQSQSIVTLADAECIDGTDNCTIRVTFNSDVNDFASIAFVNISVSFAFNHKQCIRT